MDAPPSQDQYAAMENVFQKINQKYVALSDESKKRNAQILSKVVEQIIDKMKEKSTLFAHLFQTMYYGGSYYDNLRVSEPTEYDLDFLFVLPKIIETTIIESDKPGFVHVVIQSYKNLEKQKDLHIKYRGLTDFLDDDRVNTKKVLKWMDSVVNLALNDFRADLDKPKTKPTDKKLEDRLGITDDTDIPKKNKNLKSQAVIKVKCGDVKYLVNTTLSKSGPAVTLKLECKSEDGQEKCGIDVDLVPAFVFNEDHWPRGNYRKNTSENHKTFFVVPKGPNSESTLHWRLSFQQQEKDLLGGDNKHLKPCIRLMKKLRDRYKHNISSYAIKTFFLWELTNRDATEFNKPLSVVFMAALEKYAVNVCDGKIPYFWNNRFNLIEDLKPATYESFGNCLKNIVSEVRKHFFTNPFIFADCLLSPEEVTQLTTEVSIGKKYLRHRSIAMGETVVAQTGPTIGFVSENLKMTLSKAVQAESPKPIVVESDSQRLDHLAEVIVEMRRKSDFAFEAVLEKLSNLEAFCLKLSSENRRLVELHEAAAEEVEMLKERVGDRDERKSLKSTILEKMDEIEKKLDRLIHEKNRTDENSLDLFLGGVDKLKITSDFQGMN